MGAALSGSYSIYQETKISLVDLQKATLWTTIHITAAISCACLPLLKPFLLKAIETITSTPNYVQYLIPRSLTRSRNDTGGSAVTSRRTVLSGDGYVSSSKENLFEMKSPTNGQGPVYWQREMHETFVESNGRKEEEQRDHSKTATGINIQREFEVEDSHARGL